MKDPGRRLVKRGYRLCTGGAGSHLMLVDLRPRGAELRGAEAVCQRVRAEIREFTKGFPLQH